MKTMTRKNIKKYGRKRKTMKKGVIKNTYLLKGGDAESIDNKWTFKEDPILGPMYYSFWTIRGKPVYLWTADTLYFLDGYLKKKVFDLFMKLNPTAILMKTAVDTGLNLLENNKPKIKELAQMFTKSDKPDKPAKPAMPAMPARNFFEKNPRIQKLVQMPDNIHTGLNFLKKNITKSATAAPAASGGGKRKQRKFTKRRK